MFYANIRLKKGILFYKVLNFNKILTFMDYYLNHNVLIYKRFSQQNLTVFAF